MTIADKPPQRRDGATFSSLADAIHELRRRPRDMWLDLARQDQSDRWRSGVGMPAEEYLTQLPEFRADNEEMMVLICGEAQLRHELGLEPSLEEYQRRFPDLAEQLTVQFEVSSLFQSQVEGLDWEDSEFDTDLALPGYDSLEEIGRGAAGVVYKARQQSLNRLVAVKVLASPGSDEKRSARQRQEAELLGRLRHPNVVHVYEVVYHRGHVHLVMELIEGPTLRERSSGKPWNARDAAQLILTLSEAVHAVHEAGILHRDLKPSNVLLTADGVPKVSDFGLAKLQADDNFLTTQDSILGTPSYMSPEQAAGDVRSISATSDVYSLGAILYELLTGRPPFLGVTVLDTLSLIRERDPVSPRHLQPKTPRDVETICLKCLQKSSRSRYPSAAALAADLRRFLAGEPVLARRTSPVERLGRFIRRKPAVFAAIMLLVALVGVLAVATWTFNEQQRNLSSAALVDSVATTDQQSLPQLLEKITAQSDRTLPLIRAALTSASPGEPTWVNLSVAELAADPAAEGNDLLTYLPDARVGEVPAIVDALVSRAENLSSTLWESLLDEAADDDARLRLACLAASCSASDARWTEVAAPVARALVRQHPLDMATFSNALLPARQQLVPALVALTQEPKLEPLARKSALSIAARFAAGQIDTLVKLTVDATADEFSLVFPSLQEQAKAALPRFESAAASAVSIEALAASRAWASPHEIERAYDRAQAPTRNGRHCDVAVGRFDDRPGRTLWPARSSATCLDHRVVGAAGSPTGNNVGATCQGDGRGARQARILALGQSRPEQTSARARKLLLEEIIQLYRNDPDAGVHAASRWLLMTRLDAAGIVAEVENSLPRQPTPERNWFLGPLGHSFSVIRLPASFQFGSPESELWREEDEQPVVQPRRERDYMIAVSMHEVTVEQYQTYRTFVIDSPYTPSGDCPINNVKWYDAAAYCRWLSEQDAVAEDQMVYPPVEQIGPGMKLPDNWLERTGYRMPTEAEWEFACRAGTKASRFSGPGTALLRHYAWYLSYSQDHSWPVGTLKPNQFGLFDMLGNVAERCHQLGPTPAGGAPSGAPIASSSPGTIVTDELQGTVRGGEFGDLSQNMRAARRYSVPAQAEWGTVGFRVVRTVTDSQVQSE